MYNGLLTLPTFGVAVLVVLFCVLLALGITWLVIRLSGPGLKAAYKAMVPNVGVALTAGFMLFVALIANGVIRDRAIAEEAVAAEAHYIHMARTLVTEAELPGWQAALSTHAARVVEGEWPEMAAGVRSHAAHDSMGALRKLAMAAALPSEKKQSLTEVVRQMDTARRNRLVVAVDEIPSTLWGILVFTGLIAVFFSAAAHAHSPPTAYVMAVLYGATIGAMFFAILSLDRPFAGVNGIPAVSIEAAAGVRPGS